jgi:cytochrome c551/c552
LWDYINRAMPWNAPKSLKPDEVYAVTAYMLNLADVVPDDFELSERNIAQVQARLPNRNGKTHRACRWPGTEFGPQRKPDVQGVACMKNCAAEPGIASFLPDTARNAHGDLAQQQRLVGPQRGMETQARAQPVAAAAIKPVAQLLQQNACMACHQLDTKVVGPALRDVAKKYADRSDASSYLANKIKNGGSGVWGAMPMPPQALSDAEAAALAQWLLDGAKP